VKGLQAAVRRHHPFAAATKLMSAEIAGGDFGQYNNQGA
jgi:hypothetical protein